MALDSKEADGPEPKTFPYAALPMENSGFEEIPVPLGRQFQKSREEIPHSRAWREGEEETVSLDKCFDEKRRGAAPVEMGTLCRESVFCSFWFCFVF